MNVTDLYLRVQNLLGLARNLRHYEQEFSSARGEAFNIFKIVNIGHYEVLTHSPILAELLNPKGSHGQGSVFLNTFLSLLKIDGFHAEAARITTEYYAGPKEEEKGGRLDIRITDPDGTTIIIENKIFAGEQENQLLRYHNSAPKGALFFLTLNGDEPKGIDVKSIPNLRCISYREHIIEWLQECRKEATEAPCVRETITQYIHLLQHLTNQNSNTHMNEELIRAVLETEENFLAFNTLCKVENDVYKAVFATLQIKLRFIVGEMGLELQEKEPLGDLSKKESGFSITHETWTKHQLKISFAFGAGRWKKMYFGFPKLQQVELGLAAVKLKELFDEEFGHSNSNNWWLAWQNWDQHCDWDETTFASIQFGSFETDLKKIIERLAAVAWAACAVGEPKGSSL